MSELLFQCSGLCNELIDTFYATCSMQYNSVHRMCRYTMCHLIERSVGFSMVYDLPGLVQQLILWLWLCKVSALTRPSTFWCWVIPTIRWTLAKMKWTATCNRRWWECCSSFHFRKGLFATWGGRKGQWRVSPHDLWSTEPILQHQ